MLLTLTNLPPPPDAVPVAGSVRTPRRGRSDMLQRAYWVVCAAARGDRAARAAAGAYRFRALPAGRRFGLVFWTRPSS